MLANISVAVILMYSERCLSWWYPFKYILGLKNTGFGDRDTWRLHGWKAWLASTEILVEKQAY